MAPSRLASRPAKPASGLKRLARTALAPAASLRSVPVHLRAPSYSHSAHAFAWSVVFFLYMWLGAILLEAPAGAALVISLVLAAGIFLFVRTRGAGARTGP